MSCWERLEHFRFFLFFLSFAAVEILAIDCRLKPNAESPSCWWAAAWHRMGFACWICWADWAYLEVRCAWKGLWCSKDWEEEAAYCHQLKAIGVKRNKRNNHQNKKSGRKRNPGKEKFERKKKGSNQFVVKCFHHHIFAWSSSNTKLVQFDVIWEWLIGMENVTCSVPVSGAAQGTGSICPVWLR